MKDQLIPSTHSCGHNAVRWHCDCKAPHESTSESPPAWPSQQTHSTVTLRLCWFIRASMIFEAMALTTHCSTSDSETWREGGGGRGSGRKENRGERIVRNRGGG